MPARMHAWSCINEKKFVSTYDMFNRLFECRQIYNFAAVGDKHKLIIFEVERSKVRVTARPNALLRRRHTD